ncbi:MAG TPA: hypothetical protein VFV10_20090 [Gammaproteobacteria bacterium]|nr:hypothetical protein [Gammaproteobacteria bacterium]
MWSELTYLIEKRCGESPPRGVLPARSLVALYGALTHCELAFQRLDEGAAEHGEAVLAMDALFAVLNILQSTIGLFEGEASDQLVRHLRSNRRTGTDGDAKGVLKRQVELLRRMLALEESHEDLAMPARTDFTGARRELAEFIRGSYTEEELLA